MDIKLTLVALLLITLSQTSYTQEKDIKGALTDTISIKLDNVAFDEDAYMSILDSENNTIAYYDRFENKSGPIKAVRLYNLKKELIYILVPIITENGYTVHLRNKDKSRGLINLTGKIKGLKVSYRSEVDYFQQPYDFDYRVRMGIGKVSAAQTVNYNNQEVISYKENVSAFSGVKISPFVVSKSFYLEHKLDAINWVLVIQLMNELALEVSNNRRDNIGD
ncbi:hypothetical protein [Winogradskyella sp.]|uniref:hypothetical protein n=1 Tax=Winogradskyella sp. TaxID=1883156 RepID=UPI003BAB668F